MKPVLTHRSRFFFLMRRTSSHLDFDLDIAFRLFREEADSRR
jgi:hypothetical protein